MMTGKYLDALIRKNIAARNIQCCVAQVNYNRESVYEYAKGYGDRRGNRVSRCTIFQVTSLTKPIIAALVLILLDEGKLQIGKPLSYYFHNGWHDITIRHLLTHTSGLLDVYPDEYMLRHIEQYFYVKTPGTILDTPNESQMQFFCEMADLLQQPDLIRDKTHPQKCFNQICGFIRRTIPPFYTPGTRYEYCNYGYELLSQLITMTEEQSFDQFAIERLFGPLGMHDTFFEVPVDRYGDVVKRYKPAMAANWLNKDAFMKRTTGYDGLKTTVPDMMAFMEMIQNHGKHENRQILTEASCSALLNNYNQHLPIGFSRSFGFRNHDIEQDFSGSKRSMEAIDHGGMGGAKIMLDPKYGITIVYFAVENKECDRNHYEQIVSYTKLNSISIKLVHYLYMLRTFIYK